MRALFLHGYGMNADLAEYGMLPALKAALPADVSLEVLQGWVALTEDRQFGNLGSDPANQSLVMHGRRGTVKLYGYADYDGPGSEEQEHGTWDVSTLSSVLDRVGQHIVSNGGYDVLIGFSQGGEIVANLVRRLPLINQQVPGRPVRAIAIFSTRLHHSFSPHLGGAPTVSFEPGMLHAFVSSGQADRFDMQGGADDPLFDMKAVGDALGRTGAAVLAVPHEGGHEMPKSATDPALVAMAAHVTANAGNVGFCDALLSCLRQVDDPAEAKPIGSGQSVAVVAAAPRSCAERSATAGGELW